MPTYKATQQAREKQARIREVHFAFKRDKATREEAKTDIRRALQVSASEFLAEVL
jgi:hypothetical protein